jgi:hypothetical protein
MRALSDSRPYWTMIISARLPQPLRKVWRDLATSLWQARHRGCQTPNGRNPRRAPRHGAKPGVGNPPQSHARRGQPARQGCPAQKAQGRGAGVALRWKKRGKKQAIHAKPPGPRRAALAAMGRHAQDKLPGRRPSCNQKGQQAGALPPIRHMQPCPQGQRRPPIPRHQQREPALPGKARHWPKQCRRQPPRHHSAPPWQALHGRARVRQAQRVTEQPKSGQAAWRRKRKSAPSGARPWNRSRFPVM